MTKEFKPTEIADGSNLPRYRFTFGGKQLIVVMKSPFTFKWRQATLTVNDNQLSAWANGRMIQDAMPHLSDEEREFLMTGITPEEWNKTFGKKTA